MASIEIDVTTLKGRSCKLTLTLDTTVGELRQRICNQVFYGDESELKVLYRAKYLSNPNQRLSQCGFAAGKPVKLHVVSR